MAHNTRTAHAQHTHSTRLAYTSLKIFKIIISYPAKNVSSKSESKNVRKKSVSSKNLVKRKFLKFVSAPSFSKTSHFPTFET